MSGNQNPVIQSLRTLSHRLDETCAGINDIQRRQTAGEEPDPNEFMRLLQRQSAEHTAMTAQFNLLQKPLKTVLNETK